MKILALDTSTLMATIAVIDQGVLLGEYSINQDMTHSENLMPMVDEVLTNLNIDISEIDLYGVAVGPGSFTGLRIGMATVKAFAHVNDKPIVGVSTLEGLAYNMAYSPIIIPMIDARRDRVYTGIYTWEDGELKEIVEARVMEVGKILKLASKYERVSINGNGSLVYGDRIQEVLGRKARIGKIGQNVCRAASIGNLAMEKYQAGIEDNYFTLAPTYLRETQAQRELKKNSR